MRSHEPFLLHQLELLAERLRQHRCPFGFLDSVDPHIKCDTCEKLIPKREIHDNSHTLWTEDEMFAYPNTCGPVNQNSTEPQYSGRIVYSAVRDAEGWVLFDKDGNPVEWPSTWPTEIDAEFLSAKGIGVAV